MSCDCGWAFSAYFFVENKASREILLELHDICNTVKEDCCLIIYYTGHGVIGGTKDHACPNVHQQ